MANYYEIASVKMKVYTEDVIDLDRFMLFKAEPFIDPAMNVAITKTNDIIPRGRVLSHLKNVTVMEMPNGKQGVVFFSEDGSPIAYLETDNGWQNVEIKYKIFSYIKNYSITDILIGSAFKNIIVHNGGLVVHSSAIYYSGIGVAFSAPSGTGKSTHANLWNMFYHAQILNDDAPVSIKEQTLLLLRYSGMMQVI